MGVVRSLALWGMVVLWNRCRQEFWGFPTGLTRTSSGSQGRRWRLREALCWRRQNNGSALSKATETESVVYKRERERD